MVTPVISYSRMGEPTQTDVASWGVNPANQDCLLLSVVPVFAAAFRPSSSVIAEAVPSPSIVSVSSSVAPRAMPLSMTCLHGGASIFIFLPLALVIDAIGFGGQYLPSAASVA